MTVSVGPDAWPPLANPMSLQGRTILVTGASSGIGREAGRVLAELGARVVAVARRRDRLDQLVAELPGHGHVVAPFDLASVEAISEWLKGITAAEGKLHGIAHCAGIQTTVPLRALTIPQFDEVLRVNLTAAVALTKAFRMKGVAAGPGSLVFVSSVMAMVGKPAIAAYAASKAGLQSIARVFALELAREGHRVNCVAPALVITEMAGEMQQMMTPDQFAEIQQSHPLGVGRPRDVGNAIAFLLADTSRWITGTTLVVDGGYTAQ